MDNVKQLHQTNIGPKGDNHSIVHEPRRAPQNVSLSYLKEGDSQVQSVKIDSTVAQQRPQSNTQNQNQIHISMPKKKEHRRTVGSMEEAMKSTVNPNDYIDTAQDNATKPNDKMLTESFSALDKVVQRKKQEFRDFVDHANEADKINRSRIDAGIEEAPNPDNEILYKLPDVDPERSEEVKKDNNITRVSDGEINSDGEYVDDVEKDIEDEIGHDYYDEDIEDQNNLGSDDINHNYRMGDDMTYEDDPADYEYPEDDIPVDDSDDDYKFEDIEIHSAEDKPSTDQENIDGDNISENNNTVTEDEDTTNIIDKGLKIMKFDDVDPTKNIGKVDSGSVSVDDDDFEDVLDEETDSLDNDTSTDDTTSNNLTDEERQEIDRKSHEHLKSEILKKIVNAGKKYNTSSLVVTNKVVSIKDAIGREGKKLVQRGKFPLMNAGRPIEMTALSGLEIANLANETMLAESRTGSYRVYDGFGCTPTIVNILYSHDTNPNKPATAKLWAKTIPVRDIDNLFAAVYIASLQGSNFMPRICPNEACKYSFLEELNDINNFIKFPNDKTKKKFNDIMAMPINNAESNSYESVIQIINDKYAIGLRVPSLYFYAYELAGLNDEFRSKYMTIVNLVSMIDAIYLITDDNGVPQLSRIGYKQYPADDAKNFKSKVITYSKILQEFSDRDFSILNAYIQLMGAEDTDTELEWSVPESKCPKCGRKIPVNTELTARGLVFTRQQLVDLVI